MTKLREGSIAYQLVERIDSGEEKTVAEWAEEFQIPKSNVRALLTYLRKGGHLLFPSGTVNAFGGKSVAGVVKNISGSKKLYSEIIDRQNSTAIRPRLKSLYSLLGQAINEFPSFHDEIETVLSGLLVDVVQQRETLKLANKTLQLDKTNGNTTNTNKQIKTGPRPAKKIV